MIIKFPLPLKYENKLIPREWDSLLLGYLIVYVCSMVTFCRDKLLGWLELKKCYENM